MPVQNPIPIRKIKTVFNNSAIEELFRLTRSGGTGAQTSERAGALVFEDELNQTLVGAIAAARNNPSSDFNGSMNIYVNNTGAASSGALTQLTKVGRFTNHGMFEFNSGFGSVASAYGCRAWVNFNGTGTVAIRASGNVSSITDNGVGDYTVNFASAMPDANYAVVGSARRASANEDFGFALKFGGIQSTTAVQVCSRPTSNSVLEDGATICASIFR